MTTGFVGSSMAAGDSSTYTSMVSGPAINYTCPADKKYAVITANYSVNPHARSAGGSEATATATVLNIAYVTAYSHNYNGVAESAKVPLVGTATFIVGPGQSWSTGTVVSASHAGVNPLCMANVHVSVVEIDN